MPGDSGTAHSGGGDPATGGDFAVRSAERREAKAAWHEQPGSGADELEKIRCRGRRWQLWRLSANLFLGRAFCQVQVRLTFRVVAVCVYSVRVFLQAVLFFVPFFYGKVADRIALLFDLYVNTVVSLGRCSDLEKNRYELVTPLSLQ